MNISVLKTNEISEYQWKEIVRGFNLSFNQTRTVEQLKQYYRSTCLDYSYHALAITGEGKIVGSNVITPMVYRNAFKFGYSGGTYIIPGFRNDITLLNKMLISLEEACRLDGLSVFLAVPNKNSITYFTRIAKYTLVENLPYYVVPVRISKVLNKNAMSVFNVLTIPIFFFSIAVNYFLGLFFGQPKEPRKYELVYNDNFYLNRLPQSKYSLFKKKNFECYYRVMEENGINTAYLMDYRINGVRSLKALSKAAFEILKHSHPDIIINIGNFGFRQFIFLKVPSGKEPQPLPFVYKIIDPSYNHLKDSLSNPKSWEFGLINFDAR